MVTDIKTPSKVGSDATAKVPDPSHSLRKAATPWVAARAIEFCRHGEYPAGLPRESVGKSLIFPAELKAAAYYTGSPMLARILGLIIANPAARR